MSTVQNQIITLFIPCLIDTFYPNVGEAVVRVFRKLGVGVRYPEAQTCCGQPAFNAGYRKEARSAARHFIDVFAGTDPIVCPSGSCVSMVRNHYPELFRNDPAIFPRALDVGARTFEFSEYLVDQLGVEDVGAEGRGRVVYHDSCHLLRGLRIQHQPRELLRQIRGIEFVEMDNADYCCGFGGSFSVTYPAISTAMVEDKVRHIVDARADTVVAADMGCLMNIQGMLHRKNLPVQAKHIAQMLAE
ncbi:Predicted L-lactate dehydrogenase, Fe-S oxidoreductase subunit YkgE [Olavius algarvensis associated proteobacterium Delta 3]|nr:Predicted L-lactate dehydrogenase, Fe-S oxidoreductase subunit YkgE [Olavius algarvensis associated proteobacterium Delta 3]